MELIESSNVSQRRFYNRQSGIELLKVVAIILVVLSHVVQTLTSGDAEWAIELSGVVGDPFVIILALLRYSGSLGNIIFFTCSI